MKKKLLHFLWVFVLLLSTNAYSQTRTVTGKVTGKEDGAPLPGVSVKVKGTKSGTQTDISGKFSLSVPSANATLVFSFIGYGSREVAVGSLSSVSVELVANASELSEVVVNGYTVQSKKDFTGASAHISNESFRDRPVQSFDQALAGQAPGVTATTPNGLVNNPPVIRIRGINSLSLSSDPLYIVDGLQVFSGQVGNSASNSPLSDINPEDIESVDILKDAASTAIYGSRAANGVVVITTKKGKKGTTKVNYTGWYGYTSAVNVPEVLNATQYVSLKNEARTNASLSQAFQLQTNADGSTINTKWADYAYRRSESQSHNLTISGGSDKTQYYMSAGYTKQAGFVVQNDFSRKSLRANVQTEIAKHINVGVNFSYSNSENTGVNSGSLSGQAYNTGGLARLALLLPSNLSPYNADGSYNINTVGNSIGLQNGITSTSGITISYYNPIPLLDLDKYSSTNNTIINNIFGEWELIKGLKIKTSYSVEYLNVLNETFQNPLHGDGATTVGSATNTNQKYNRSDITNTLSYARTIGSARFSVTGGYEEIKNSNDNFGANRTGISDPFYTNYQGGWTNIAATGNSYSSSAFRSFFSLANFSYKDKYLVSGSFRRDGLSQLATNHKYGSFGGASIAWVISEEGFFKNGKLGEIFTDMRLRGGYGVVGNSAGLGDYASLSTYGSGLYGALPSLLFTQSGNPLLKWETSNKSDGGVNFTLLNGRLNVDADYFYNNIFGLIQNATQAPSKGIPGGSIAANIGSMTNKGFELGITGKIFSKGPLQWTANLNFSTSTNKVTSLANGNADVFGSTSGLEVSNITRVGYSISQLFTVPTQGVNPANGQRIFLNRFGRQVQYNQVGTPSKWTYLDGTTAPAIDGTLDGALSGNTVPKYYGGFNNTVAYKNFDLVVNVVYSGGNKIYYGTRGTLLDQRFWNNSTEVLDRWTAAGQVTDIPKVVYGDNYSNGSAIPIGGNAEDGSYVKLKTVGLGYRLPTTLVKKANIASVRIYAQAFNLHTFTKYKGSDPEISSNGGSNSSIGDDRNSVPTGRTITFGISVGF